MGKFYRDNEFYSCGKIHAFPQCLTCQRNLSKNGGKVGVNSSQIKLVAHKKNHLSTEVSVEKYTPVVGLALTTMSSKVHPPLTINSLLFSSPI